MWFGGSTDWPQVTIALKAQRVHHKNMSYTKNMVKNYNAGKREGARLAKSLAGNTDAYVRLVAEGAAIKAGLVSEDAMDFERGFFAGAGR